MGICLSLSSPQTKVSKKITKPLSIETLFNLPSPIPTWPEGGKFASGTIDLGGLQVCQVSTFNKIWAAHEGGPNDVGATFFEPSPTPQGFSVLGCYGQPNNKALFGWVLAGKDVTNDPTRPALKRPIDYTLIWSSESLKIKQDGSGYIWLPTPPIGYKATGHVITNSPDKPSLDKIRCVRTDFTDQCVADAWIWGPDKNFNPNGFNVFSLRPTNIGTQAFGVSSGTFIAQNGGNVISISCLKNVIANLSSMPNLEQIQALIRAYSPLIYFHPKEQYHPSSVSWFFKNGALLYKKGDESNPVPIDPLGSNLPQDASNDGAYWLDLPVDKAAKELVKKGDLQDVGAYLHIKPMLGATFTDIAVWIFYPFNGPAKVKVKFIDVSLGRIGEHIGDWEHVTLRISNFDGALASVYFSEHSRGAWVDAPELEFENSNKPVAYASFHGHAFYPKPGLVLQGNGDVGIRNDTAKSNAVMDTGARFLVVAAEYLGVVEPPWLNYARKWGPKITYDTVHELEVVEKLLPGKLKSAFKKFEKSLPKEVLGEEGPTGPKVKNNWNGDEIV